MNTESTSSQAKHRSSLNSHAPELTNVLRKSKQKSYAYMQPKSEHMQLSSADMYTKCKQPSVHAASVGAHAAGLSKSVPKIQAAKPSVHAASISAQAAEQQPCVESTSNQAKHTCSLDRSRCS
jgi:hypothetical protein